MLVQPSIDIDHFPAIQNDFIEAVGIDYCSIDFQIDTDDPWNKHIGISPQDFRDILIQDLPGKPEVHVQSSADGKISIELSEKDSKFYDHRSIHNNEIQAGVMTVDLKGCNTGKRIFRNYVELGVHLQLYGFIVYAADDNGAYVWAKAGVPLLEESDFACHDDLRKILTERLKAIRDFIDPEVYSKVENLIKLESIYDINAIADLDVVISQGIYFRHTDGDIINDAEEERLRHLIEFCTDNNKDFTLARYLLNGASCRGYLNFCDDIAMPRIEKYVDGFNTIELIYPENPVLSTQPENKAPVLVA